MGMEVNPIAGIAVPQSGGAATAAAPTAFTAVAILGIPAAGPGIYKVDCVTFQRGTPDTNDWNMQFFVGSGSVALQLPSLSTPQKTTLEYVPVAAGQSIQIRTFSAAGGAGAIYSAFLVATRIA